MGLFDRFKKKDQSTESTNSATPKEDLFLSISKYNEYIVRFIRMQQEGNYAPISAYEKKNGEIVGFVYTISDDGSYSLSAVEAITRMQSTFEQKLAEKSIKSYAILYHSQFANDGNHAVAVSEMPSAITVAYHFSNGEHGKIGLTYEFENDEVRYHGFRNFSQEQNTTILNTYLQPKDYFTDRVEIKPPVTKSSIGLTIKGANSYDLSDTWCGIFGFSSYRSPGGSQALIEHFALAMTKMPTQSKNNVRISSLSYKDVDMKAFVDDNGPKAMLPVVKTDYVLDVENKGILEWENLGNNVAVISGGGRDTFGISYVATDYAENKGVYHSQKKLKMKMSGIVFVLNISDAKSDEKTGYSEDFTMYMPNNDVPNYACFDFIGQLEDLRETELLENGGLKGYIMKMRLITNSDVEDRHVRNAGKYAV
jgi:hypothetical protein